MDVELKDRILGEAKFLRAYFYFNLVNIFGEIPLKLNPPINPDEINKSKSPTAIVYAQIEKDLQEAIDRFGNRVHWHLMLAGHTKGAALGLLAKTFLYQQKWDDALAAIAAVDALGIYSLERSL